LQDQQLARSVEQNTKENGVAEPRVKHARFDPYKNFRFRVKWDGRYVAGLNKSAPLNGITKAIEHREGTGPNTSRQSPGRSKYEAVTLQRGVTHDAEFEQWASTAWKLASARTRRPAYEGLCKDITIEVYDKVGQLTLAYKVFCCWVSEYQAPGRKRKRSRHPAPQARE
jgi:phage tail-like protein